MHLIGIRSFLGYSLLTIIIRKKQILQIQKNHYKYSDSSNQAQAVSSSILLLKTFMKT